MSPYSCIFVLLPLSPHLIPSTATTDDDDPQLSLTVAAEPIIKGEPPIGVAMGILSWFTGSPKPSQSETTKTEIIQAPKSETPGMNGAIEVPRPDCATVFEFGSVAATGDRFTLAGYCPVSDDLEPCRWEIIPAGGKDAPQFRVVF